MEIYKDIFYIFSMLASTAFSIFMMYSMYKTKKGVEKIANTTQKFTEELGEKVNKILPSFGIELPTSPTFDKLPENQNTLLEEPDFFITDKDEIKQVK